MNDDETGVPPRYGRHDILAGSIQGLDPLLVSPLRLFLMILLADLRWREFSYLRDTLGVTDTVLSRQLTKLCQAGYVQKRPVKQYKLARLSSQGCDQLGRHLDALRMVVAKAAQTHTLWGLINDLSSYDD